MAGNDRSPNRIGTCPKCGGTLLGSVKCSECGKTFNRITFAQKTCGKECSRLRFNRRRREWFANLEGSEKVVYKARKARREAIYRARRLGK